MTNLVCYVYAEDKTVNERLDFVFLDIGLNRGSIDPADVVLDLSKSCDTDEIYIIGEGRTIAPNKLTSLNEQLDSRNQYQAVADFGFPFQGDFDSFKENFFIPKFANYNRDTVFVLLPEAHPHSFHSLPPIFAEKNALMDLKRSFFSIQWISHILSEDDNTVLNLNEGIAGLETAIENFTPSSDPMRDAIELFGYNTHDTISNVFTNNLGVYSAKLEDSFYLFFDSMIMDGYQPGMSFEETFERMTPEGLFYDERVIPMIRETYDHIKSWNQKQLNEASENICEFRSKEIAERALAYAQDKNPKLVLLTFGMAHTGGIIKALENAQMSYLILQANSREL